MSSKSSTYLAKDYGKLNVGTSDYLPTLVKNIFEHDHKTYSPQKFHVRAPNSRLENEEDFSNRTFDWVLEKLGIKSVGPHPNKSQITELMLQFHRLKLSEYYPNGAPESALTIRQNQSNVLEKCRDTASERIAYRHSSFPALMV